MRKILFGIVLLMAFGFVGCKANSSDDIDGGVVTHDSGEDAPKVIESTEITSFECELSFISAALNDESELAGKVYKLSAVLERDKVKVKNDWRDRAGNGEISEFETDSSFMAKLQEIVSKYDLAKYNGYTHHVSGLPDMYGERIDIEYASGESVYASNNQDGFLPAEAAEEVVELFGNSIFAD